jgi:mono/diheme cytochrome c family protein
MMKRLLKWLGFVVLGLVGLLAVAWLAVTVISERRIAKTYDVAVAPLTIPTDAAGLAEGRRLVTIRGCTDCHAADLGGKPFLDDPMIGSIHTPNLTAGEGSRTGDFTAADWARAIRHGVGPDGHSLLIMPSYEFATISDEQVGQMVAYLASLPSVDRVPTEARLGPLGRILFVANQLPLLPAELVDHSAVAPAAVPAEASVEYGRYMASSCTGCHGPDLAGGPTPGSAPDAIPASNLTPSGHLSAWTLDGFKTTLRTGVTPEGRELDPLVMPWTLTREMTDVEVEALWLYLNSVPPAEPAG